MHIRKLLVWILVGVSFVLGVVSIVVVKSDPEFTHVWAAFWLHISSFLLIGTAYCVSEYNTKKLKEILQEKEILIFGGVFLFALMVNFFQLTMYPYSSVGDEVRDSGLFAKQIATGETKNIFAYGAYDGYGLIIPTIASFFYNVFGGSVLTYRFPAAWVSVLDIVVLYILLRQITNKRISAIGASILTVLPIHIFFARTQLVVAFNGLWTTLMLFATYQLCEENSVIGYIFLGSLMGFASQFHATVRVVAILLLLLSTVFKSIALLRRKIKFWPTVWGIVLLLLFAVISFGPQMLFSTTENFFHTGRFVLQKNLEDNQAPSLAALTTIGQNYLTSLGAWVINPVGGTFFHDDQPLVPGLFIPLFLLGIAYALIFVRKTFIYMLVGLVILIPFFSSAITESINAEHRLNSELSLVAIFCSIGIYITLRLLRHRYLQTIFLSLVGVYILFLGSHFFLNRSADIQRGAYEYVSMNIIYALQNQIQNKIATDTYCVIVSPDDAKNFGYLHYAEQYQYFLPHTTLDIQSDASVPDSDAYLYKGMCSGNAKQPLREENIVCNDQLNFMCPRDWTGKLRLYSD